MIKSDLPLVKLEGYNFNCVRCGKCCEVLNKTELSKKKLIYRYDFQGKLSNSPFTTTTVYYNQRETIRKYIKQKLANIREYFVPFESFFLKDHPFEFIYSYQVKTNGKWCIFYEKDKQNCSIYPVRPLICRTYPQYIDKAIFGGNVVDQPNISKCTSVDGEIKKRYPSIQNIMYVRFDPRYTTYEQRFPEQSKFFKRAVYIVRKINIFLELWCDFFINPIKVEPNMVKNYKQLDMSQFWSWLGENKKLFDNKRLLTMIKNYKLKIDELNKLFDLNISNFLYK